MKFFNLNIIAITVLALALISSVNAEPSHGWLQKPIRLDYNAGGPNIMILQTTGLKISHVSSREYTAFGYFTYNSVTNAIIEEHAVNFDGDGSAYIGEFEQGVHVGTWLTTDEGIFYSIPGLNDSNQHRATYLGDTAEGHLKVGLEGGPKWSGTDYREMVVAFEPVAHAPAGQPLPGIIISCLLGLGVAGISKIRRRGKNIY